MGGRDNVGDKNASVGFLIIILLQREKDAT